MPLNWEPTVHHYPTNCTARFVFKMDREKVCRICIDILHPSNTQAWKLYLENHESEFPSKRSLSQELSHSQYSLYERFTDMIENTISNSCNDNSIDPTQFHNFFREFPDDPVLNVFSQLLLMSTR